MVYNNFVFANFIIILKGYYEIIQKSTIVGGDGLIALYIAVAWGLGLLFYYMTVSWKLFVAVVAVALFMWSYRTIGKKVYLLLIVIIVGSTWAWIDDQRSASQLDKWIMINEEESISLLTIGKVDSFPVVDGDRLRFFFKTEIIELEDHVFRAKERIWVNLRVLTVEEQEKASTITRGDQLRLPLTISMPKPPTNPGAFDFPAYLWQQYSLYEGTSEGLDNIISHKPAAILGWQGVTKVRLFLEERLNQIFAEENSGLLKAMLLGNQKEVSADIEEMYRNTGIIHIVAISGTHVMLVIGALILLLRASRLTRERTYEILFIFLPFYMILTGLSPSVVRASLMGMIYLMAKRLHFRYSSWQAISFVFILLTLIQPRMLFGVGFQLSFAVTLGLILFTEPFAKKIKELSLWLPDKAASAISLTMVAQICAFPILAITFHQFPLASFPVNLLLMPIYALIIPWGYFAMMISAIWPSGAAVIAYPLDGLLSIIHHILHKVTQYPQFLLSIEDLPLWWWLAYGVLIVLLVLPLQLKKRRGKTFIIIFCTFILLLPPIANELDRSIKITFIDVGQGDSILIQGPRNQSILIDGGGEGFVFMREDWQKKRNPYDVGKNVVVPALRSLGVTQLNWVVMTHGDGDHIGGLQEVIRNIPVGKVLVNGVTAATELELELQALIAEKQIPVYTATAGPWIKWRGDIRWDILNPSDRNVVEKGNDNDASVVLQLSAYGRNILFTGDLEADGEVRIRDQYDRLTIDVLKVGHHGSKSSTTEQLLEGITPKIAVISVGKNNRYGHPHPDVMNRLHEHDVEVFRTDQDGALTFTIKRNGQMTYKRWK